MAATQIVYDQLGRPYEALPVDAPTQAQLDAVAQAIPRAATTVPKTEMPGGKAGDDTQRFATADHAHPRVTSTTVGTVQSGNTAVVEFTRTFTAEPGINYSELPATADTTAAPAADTSATAQPTTHKVIAWTKGPTATLPNAAATAYTGCTVRVYKAQTVPQNLVNLLLGGVFNLFGASVVGTRFSIIAVARSDVNATTP